jgi:hypothetical protein
MTHRSKDGLSDILCHGGPKRYVIGLFLFVFFNILFVVIADGVGLLSFMSTVHFGYTCRVNLTGHSSRLGS